VRSFQGLSASSTLNGGFRSERLAAPGQQATFTDTSSVFELNVRNREANQALPGQRRSSGHAN
jgi:hypothetical protein